MANLVFISDCGDSTGDLSELSSPGAAFSVQTGTRAYQVTLAGSGVSATVAGVIADAGRRISFYFRKTANPSSITRTIISVTAEWSLGISSTRKLVLGAESGTSTGATTLLNNTWDRITIASTITNISTNQFRVFLDDGTSAECTLSNKTLTSTGTADLSLGDIKSVV